jgi:hypothetical protein
LKKILAVLTLVFAMLIPSFAVVPYTSEAGKFTVSFVVAPTVEVTKDKTTDGFDFIATDTSATTDEVSESVMVSDYPFAITSPMLGDASRAALKAANVKIEKESIAENKGRVYHTAVGTINVGGKVYRIFYANTAVGNRLYQIITVRLDGPSNADVDVFLTTFDILPAVIVIPKGSNAT